MKVKINTWALTFGLKCIFLNEKETVFIHYQRAELASTLKVLDRVSLVFMRVS